MDTNKPDNSGFGPIRLLPTMVFDTSDGKGPAPKLSPEEAPVTLLPPVVFDMSKARPVPFLRVTAKFRPDTPAARVASDLFEFQQTLDRLERNHGGSGLRPSVTPCEDGLTIRITLIPASLDGAKERLDAISQVARQPGVLTAPSLESWEAAVVDSAE